MNLYTLNKIIKCWWQLKWNFCKAWFHLGTWFCKKIIEMWKAYGQWMTTDKKVIIPHMDLWSRWAKNINFVEDHKRHISGKVPISNCLVKSEKKIFSHRILCTKQSSAIVTTLNFRSTKLHKLLYQNHTSSIQWWFIQSICQSVFDELSQNTHLKNTSL